jgi:hypothetical protein
MEARAEKNGANLRIGGFVVGCIVVCLSLLTRSQEQQNVVTEQSSDEPTKPVLVKTDPNGLQHWRLEPGGSPLRFNRLGAGPINWYSESSDYVVRYIKRDGLPWISEYSNNNGWIPAGVDNTFSPSYVRSVLGEILRIEIGLPATRVVQQGGQLVSVTNEPIILQVTKRPVFDEPQTQRKSLIRR